MRHLVLLQPQDTGGYQATAPGLPGCQSEGATEEEALANIRQVIVETLQQVKIAAVDIPDSVSSDPWTQVIGMYADEVHESSQFEEFQKAMGEQPTAVRRSLTKDEVQAMLDASPDPRDKAAIMLVFGAGLQVSELTSLTWDDVTDDAENPIKLRVMSTDAPTRQVLVERQLWNKYVAPLFFASLEGGAAGCTSTPAEPRIFPVSLQRLQQTIEEAVAYAGIEKKVSSQR